MLNARGQNGLQFLINYFSATDAHLMRLQVPTNKAAYLNVAKLLLDAGLDPNTIDLLTGESVIYDAIRINDKEMVSLLLNYVSIIQSCQYIRMNSYEKLTNFLFDLIPD